MVRRDDLELVRAVRLLAELGYARLVSPFILKLGEDAETPGEATGFVWRREVREWMLPGTREVRIRVTPPFGDEAAVELTVFVSRNLR
ncbi:MAG: hypothetical protein ABGY42_11480 [bacterium]